MSSPESSTTPRVSVIIPAKDRGPQLDATLAALRASRHDAFEVIVVDDGSTDDTAAVAARHGARLLHHETNRGAAAARNTGAREARAEVLLFLDSDVLVPPDLVERAERAFDRPEAQAVSGLLARDALHPNFASQYDTLYMHYQYWTHPEEFNIFYTSCAAIRRRVFLEHRGFDENYRGAGIEDMEFGQRLRANGVPLRIAKDLQVTHAHRFGLWELLNKNARTAAGTLKIMLRNRTSGRRSPRMVAPQWSFLLGIPLTWSAFGLLLLAPLLDLRIGLLSAVLLALVVALNRPFLSFVAQHRGALFLAAGIPFLFANYVFYGLGILTGAATFAAGSRY